MTPEVYLDWLPQCIRCMQASKAVGLFIHGAVINYSQNSTHKGGLASMHYMEPFQLCNDNIMSIVIHPPFLSVLQIAMHERLYTHLDYLLC